MKQELFLFGLTGILIYNTYYDNKIGTLIRMNEKYLKIGFYVFTAFTIYMFFRRHPTDGKSMLVYANDIIRYMPVDKNTSDVLTPLMDFTKNNITQSWIQGGGGGGGGGYRHATIGTDGKLYEGFTSNNQHVPAYGAEKQPYMSAQTRRMLNSGRIRQSDLPRNSQSGPVVMTRKKRSVSETKKKFVASQQNWKCGHCRKQLDHTFEVDHIRDLQHGGDNSVQNLVALCRNCHGRKTSMSKL